MYCSAFTLAIQFTAGSSVARMLRTDAAILRRFRQDSRFVFRFQADSVGFGNPLLHADLVAV